MSKAPFTTFARIYTHLEEVRQAPLEQTQVDALCFVEDELGELEDSDQYLRETLDDLKKRFDKLEKEREDLIEDRRRLLKTLDLREYEWMAKGGVYFVAPYGE